MKTTKILLFLLLLQLLQPCLSQAQYNKIKWQYKFGGSKDDYPNFISASSDNGFIICGSSSSYDGDLKGNQGGDDVWVVKTDGEGNLEWQKNFGGSKTDIAKSVIQTNDDGFFITGYTSSSDKDITLNKGKNDIWCIKTDFNGIIEWQKTFGGSEDDRGNYGFQTKDGGYIICGSTNSTDGDAIGNLHIVDYWVVKTDSVGNIKWQRTYGGNYVDVANKIIEVNDGYIVIGYSSSTNGDITNNLGGPDVWIIKIDTGGNLVWQKNYGGSSSEDGVAIIPTVGQDGYIFTGYTKSVDSMVSVNNGKEDFWVVKIDGSGNLLWEKTYGGTQKDVGYNIAIAASGYVISGFTESNDIDVSGNHSALGDFWVINIDANGSLKWQRALGGTGIESACCIVPKQNVSFVVLGKSDGLGGDISNYIGLNDFWLVNMVDSALDIATSPNIINQIKLYPTFTSTNINIDGFEVSNDNYYTIDIVSIDSRKLKTIKTKKPLSIDVSNFQTGLYFALIEYNGRKKSFKFLKY